MPFRSSWVDPTGDHMSTLGVPAGVALLFEADSNDVEVWIRAIETSETGYYIDGDADTLINGGGFPLLGPSTIFNSRINPGDVLYTAATGNTPSGKLFVLIRST